MNLDFQVRRLSLQLSGIVLTVGFLQAFWKNSEICKKNKIFELRLANNIQSCDFIRTNHAFSRDTSGAENPAIAIKIDGKKNLTTKNFYNKMN